MGDCQSKYSDDGKIFVCARGAGHLGPHQCYPWSWHEEGAMKPTVPPTTPALDRASIPAMNITNAVPPICTKHHEIGDELRKLNERLREDGVIAGQRYGALLDHAEAQATAIERLAAQLTALRAEAACKCEVIAKFRGGGCAKDPRKCPIHGYTEVPVARKKKQERKRTARKSR